MIGRHKTSIIAVCIGCLFGLMGCARPPTAVPATPYRGESLTVRDWLAVGPFEASSPEGALDEAFLRAQGDEGMTEDEFARIVADFEQVRLAGRVDRRAHWAQVRSADVIFFPVALQIPVRDSPNTVVYAACRLRSEKAQTVYAVLGCKGQALLLGNGQVVQRFPATDQGRLFEHIFQLPLQRGDNFLLLKLAGLIPDFSLRIESTAEVAAASALQLDGVVLQTAIVPEKGPIELAEWSSVHGQDAHATVLEDFHWKHPPIPAADISVLPPGLYWACVTVNGIVYREPFCLGSPEKLRDALMARAQPFAAREDVTFNIGAIQRRLENLFVPKNRKPENWEWCRKVVYELTAFERIVSALETKAEPFKGVPGLHLRGYRSRIDDSIQYYRVYIPGGAGSRGPRDQEPRDQRQETEGGIQKFNAEAGWPVVVQLAAPVRGKWPFIQSPILAQHQRVEEEIEIAERHHAIFLWPGYRNSPNGSPCEFTHLDEVLVAVARDYPIDPHRVSLIGECAAMPLAAMAVLEWPERFSGVGALHGIFHRRSNRYEDTGEFDHLPDYQAWVRQTDPADDHWAVLKGTPLWVLHNGAVPGHGDLYHSLAFMDEAKKGGWKPRFEEVPRSDPSSNGAREMLVEWLLAQRRENPSARRGEGMFAAHGPGGPVCRAFAERFTLVEGTGGTDADRAAIKRLSAAFRDAWKTTHAAECRVMTDTAVEKAEKLKAETLKAPKLNSAIARSLTPSLPLQNDPGNLVLIGNAETNAVWKRFGAALPVGLYSDRVEIAGKKWAGAGLGVQAVFPHPDGGGRLIVIIGAANLVAAKFGGMDLSIDGWFDYAVWRRGELLDAGHYPKKSKRSTWDLIGG